MTRTRLLDHAAWAAAVALLLAAAAARAAHDHGAMNHSLPPGPEKAHIEQMCSVCHPLQRVLNAGGSVAGWQDRLRRMQRWGARIPAEEMEPLARYLAAALPPRPRVMPTLLADAATSALQEVRVQQIQGTLRYAARVTGPREVLLVDVTVADRQRLVAGQRVRLFAAQQRGNLTSAVVTGGSGADGNLRLRPVLDLQPGALYIAEIPVTLGRDLAVANDALIPDGAGFRVLVQDSSGAYASRPIRLGYGGDQVTQVVSGLAAGEQVVSLGTFFIDAEQSMESAP